MIGRSIFWGCALVLVLTAVTPAPPGGTVIPGDGAQLVHLADESGLIYNRGPNKGGDQHDWREAPAEPGKGDGPRN